MPNPKKKKAIAEASKRKRTDISKLRRESQSLKRFWRVEAGAMADTETDEGNYQHKKSSDGNGNTQLDGKSSGIPADKSDADAARKDPRRKAKERKSHDTDERLEANRDNAKEASSEPANTEQDVSDSEQPYSPGNDNMEHETATTSHGRKRGLEENEARPGKARKRSRRSRNIDTNPASSGSCISEPFDEVTRIILHVQGFFPVKGG